jgi:peptidoglycan/xylan/chitin deacetylase (PgdA/CDA1 family)
VSTKKHHFFHRLRGALFRRVIGTLTHVTTPERVAALTFDDGPNPEFTPQLLEILERHGARGTFFVVGEAASRQPGLIRQMAQAGHAIGNHTWDHPSIPLISGPERRRQIRRCAQAIAPYGARLFRPPYGHQDLAARLDALWLGYQVVTWNLTAQDWLERDAVSLARRLVEGIRPGSIVLLHDGLYPPLVGNVEDRRPMLAAVEAILTELRSYRFVTVPALMAIGRPRYTDWRRPPDSQWLEQAPAGVARQSERT